MDELKDQLPSKPSTIVLSVGGGGLLLGVLEGLMKHGELFELLYPSLHETKNPPSLQKTTVIRSVLISIS
jgi:hypothetical protein